MIGANKTTAALFFTRQAKQILELCYFVRVYSVVLIDFILLFIRLIRSICAQNSGNSGRLILEFSLASVPVPTTVYRRGAPTYKTRSAFPSTTRRRVRYDNHLYQKTAAHNMPHFSWAPASFSQKF